MLRTLRNSFLILAVSFTISSCHKKKNPDPVVVVTTVDQDKQNITNTFKDINACVGEVKSGKLVTLVKTIFQINQGTSVNPDWLGVVLDSLPNAFEFDKIDTDGVLDAGYHAGTYTYNKTSKAWDKTSGPSGQMKFLFPSINGGANDLNLTLNGYTDESHNFDGTAIGLPKTFNLNFSQNTQTLVDIKLNNVTYEELETVTIPIYIDVDMVLAPLTIDLTARRVNPTLFDMNLSITNGSHCNTKLFAEVKLKNSDLENLVESDVDYVKGYISHGNLKVTSNIDADVLLNIDNPTTTQVNSLTDIDVLYNEQKIADLEFMDIDNSINMNVVYKDGTKDDANQKYIVPFLDDLELTLFDLVGNWN